MTQLSILVPLKLHTWSRIKFVEFQGKWLLGTWPNPVNCCVSELLGANPCCGDRAWFTAVAMLSMCVSLVYHGYQCWLGWSSLGGWSPGYPVPQPQSQQMGCCQGASKHHYRNSLSYRTEQRRAAEWPQPANASATMLYRQTDTETSCMSQMSHFYLSYIRKSLHFNALMSATFFLVGI